MTYEKMLPSHKSFPQLLKKIQGPPKQLFWTGNDLSLLMEQPRLAIVGSRKVSPYGKQVTLQLARELAGYGVVIVSGLALGVDALAHRGALEAGGKTIAVLPCSLDAIYPASHNALARQIVDNGGTLISEYAPDTPFLFKYNFVARNRLISGLSNAVLITEAAKRSGSLHTATFALEQGRDVLVVPGNIDSPTSVGTNNLIKIGATVVTSVDDVLQVLNIKPKKAGLPRKGSTPAEQTILDLLAGGIHEGNQLLVASGLTTAEFNQTITMMEILGLIKAGGANTWY